MKRVFKIMLFMVLMVVFLSGVLEAGESVGSNPALDYIIGDGDVLMVSVWKEEALTRQLVVLPGGKISFPLIGEIIAGGKTVAELKNEMDEKISRFIPDPVLTVEVQKINSLLIYVIGKVNQPGRFVLNTQVDILQALAMAGGLNPFARRNKIQVFRKTGTGQQMLMFKYDEVVEGRYLGQNVLLRRGDVIVVP